MKICHVTCTLPKYHSDLDGGAQATYRLMLSLIREGIENVAITLKPLQFPEKKEFEVYSVRIAEEKLGRIGKLFKRPYDLIAYKEGYNLLKKIKPNIVHLHNFGGIGFGIILAAKKLRIPVVFSVYNYWCFCPNQTLVKKDNSNCYAFHGKWCNDCLDNKRFLQKFMINKRKLMFDKYLFKNVDKFIALSKFEAELLNKYGVSKEKISIVPLSIEKKELKKEKIEKNSIFYIGLITPRKGMHILLEAMPSVLKKIPNAKLYVVGDYYEFEKSYKERIENMIKEKKLEKNVIILGKKSHKEVEKLLRKANVIVIPEQWNNMSPVLVSEGMVLEKSVIASNIGGIPEFIEDGKTGLLVKHSSPEDFAEKIIYALKNRGKMRKMEKNARKKALSIFNEKETARKMIEVYDFLL